MKWDCGRTCGRSSRERDTGAVLGELRNTGWDMTGKQRGRAMHSKREGRARNNTKGV